MTIPHDHILRPTAPLKPINSPFDLWSLEPCRQPPYHRSVVAWRGDEEGNHTDLLARKPFILTLAVRRLYPCWSTRCEVQKLNQNIKNISNEVLRIFLMYRWPGNVREMEHVIEGSMDMFSQGEIIETDHLPVHFIKAATQPQKKILSWLPNICLRVVTRRHTGPHFWKKQVWRFLKCKNDMKKNSCVKCLKNIMGMQAKLHCN